MDKGKIAEWFISLVMEREQAAAIVGDLLEAGASKSVGWFWSNVLRTWAMSVWRDVRSHPGFVLGLAMLGILVNAAGCFVASLAMALLERTIWAGLSGWEASLWLFAERLLVVSVGAFAAGRWIARFSLGKEVAVCLAMVLVAPPILNVLDVLMWGFLTLAGGPVAVAPLTFVWWNNGWMLFSLVPYLMGAMLARRRQGTGVTGSGPGVA
ncbi:MAG TPA: hypothetical protein VG838_12565 [Opitutaceae bacterium]|nr:hypothetical protein [Opitutaceae bacterium]HWA10278.1 hypothetical protein [Opitutaceae bacterium]